MTEAPRIVRLGDVAGQPWRNGGGITRELFAWPDAAGWRVRISVADVNADGQFSAFPGVIRWFAVLDGEGVALSVGDRCHVLRAGGEPLCFDGGAAAHARLLGGATRDLNLMLQGVGGGMQRVVDGQAWPSPGVAAGVYTLDGGTLHVGDGHDGLHVSRHSLAWFAAAPAQMCFAADAGSAAAAWWLWADLAPAAQEPR